MTAVRESPLVTELEEIRALLLAYRDGEPAPEPTAHEGALDRLFGLSPFERRLLLLAAGVELDGSLAALVSTLQGGDDPRPAFALALAALPGAHWDALAPNSPLRRWRLVELGAGTTLATRPLRVDERVLHHLTGTPAPDTRLEGIVEAAHRSAALAGGQRKLVQELAATVAELGTGAVVRLDGEDEEAVLGVARELAGALGRLPLVIRGGALPAPGPELATLARLIDREALLVPGLPVIDPQDASEPALTALLETLEAPLVVVAGTQRARARGRTALRRTVALPTPAEQRALWAAALPDEDAEEVAQHYRLGATEVAAIARELRARPGDLRALCRERSRTGLDGLADRVDSRAGWDDLVLPPGHMEVLRDIARQVRHRTLVYERWGFAEKSARGLGVTALFAGESGTGKTLAAEVLAHELGLDLYRIDLSATVSKYIGETEKNLRRVFAAAEAGGAVLLFDEADALFGKRGDVKDGHDRYANLEVAYLLQRMETYRGLAILTTNLRANVDRAFLRRLRFVLQFPFPDAGQREGIWRRAFPRATPLEGIEPDRLARMVVSGGSIRSMALAAAFSAAEDGTAITPAHVLRAARVEYAKAERTLTAPEREGWA